MKVRIGIGAGAAAGNPISNPEVLGNLANDVVALGFDSLWLPELLTAATSDPVVGLAWASGRQPALKVGTTMLLPGRHLLRLAKQAASLDALSGGRFLVTLVPGVAQGAERTAVGPAPAERGGLIDEAMPLLRQLWAGEEVTYHGRLGHLGGVRLQPLPVQEPFEVWSGGSVRSSLERCGRLFDGWLPAFTTPEEVEKGRRVVEESAAAAGRAISPEHFGVSLLYAQRHPGDAVAGLLAARLKGRPLEAVMPVGLPALRELLQRFVGVGFSKFVVRPLDPPASWRAELEELATAVGDLQT